MRERKEQRRREGYDSGPKINRRKDGGLNWAGGEKGRKRVRRRECRRRWKKEKSRIKIKMERRRRRIKKGRKVGRKERCRR